MRRVWLGAVALGVVVACTFDEKAIAVPPPQVVVHAVLDPGVQAQQVLVERTLSGTVDIRKNQRFDADDPINTGGGVPISGAAVTITGPDGTFIASEALEPEKGRAYGAGRYVTPFGTFVRPGASYVLRVRTPDGTVVTGRTTVPTSSTLGTSSRVDLFNRDHDSVRIAWRGVAGARSYLVRAESPFGPFLIFTDSTHVTLDGDLRNYFASSLERVFIPGARQRVTVSAVDSNFFDYYRSRNDPFTGSGIINRLEGGIGLFGAAMIIGGRTVDVVQDVREPSFEGLWDGAGSPPPFVDVFRLYVETPGETAALSGWYARDRVSGNTEGLIGTRTKGRVVLQFVANQNAADTVAVFSGEQRGDSLIGTFSGVTGRVLFIKRPSQSQ
ncbi:MAG: DUF4249 family protein [Gemmatimonadaceae bacterium]